MELYDIVKQGEEVQIRTKSELFVVEFDDPDKRKIFEQIAQRYASKPRSNKLFSALFMQGLERKYSKEKVLTVLEELKEFNILPQPLYRYLDNDEATVATSNDRKQAQEPIYALSNVRLLIIGSEQGVNALKQKAEPLKFSSIEVKTFARNWDKNSVERAMDQADFMIVEASEWNPDYLHWINKKALSRNMPWLFIEGIGLNKLKIGPIFHGRETACYNCLVKRQQSNRDEDLLPYDEQYEAFLTQHNILSKPDQSLFHAAQLFGILSSLALIEVTKFYKYWSVPALWGHYITLDLFTLEMERHKVLKVPNCPVCKPELAYNSSPWLEAISLHHDA